MANKKKVTTAAVAAAAAAALMLGGTFAWQSISQTALNEASDVINPGGRLHDDFNGENKDVYVENFADDPIYARILLSEYFEIIANYDAENPNAEQTVHHQILGSKNEDGTYNYDTFYFDGNVDENNVVSAGNDTDGTAYWSWKTGGSTIYMPTFNMNKDSLAADINGIYEEGNIGTISDRILDMSDPEAQYSEYTEYTAGDTETGDEIYDADANDVEDDGITTIAGVEHTAQSTETGSLISMEEWANDYNSEAGPYWVYDTDGWVYWAQAIPGRNEDGSTNATGLLLDSIELNQVMDDTWYYAIHVVAQFVTADDVGKSDGTGFYDTSEGLTAPSAAAEELLKTIGVTSVDDESGDNTDNDDDDEEDILNYGIHCHTAQDGTIYVSEPAGFSAGESEVTFYIYDYEIGSYSYNPDENEWSLESSDGHTYEGIENEDGSYTVHVEDESIAVGNEYNFKVIANYSYYSGTAKNDMTVIIGEPPAIVFDDVTEVTMGKETNFFVSDKWGCYPEAALSLKSFAVDGVVLSEQTYCSFDADWGEIVIDLRDAAADIEVGDVLTITMVLTDGEGNQVAEAAHEVTVLEKPLEIWIDGEATGYIFPGEYALSVDGETEGWTFELTDGSDALAQIDGTALTVSDDAVYEDLYIQASHTDGRVVSCNVFVEEEVADEYSYDFYFLDAEGENTGLIDTTKGVASVAAYESDAYGSDYDITYEVTFYDENGQQIEDLVAWANEMTTDTVSYHTVTMQYYGVKETRTFTFYNGEKHTRTYTIGIEDAQYDVFYHYDAEGNVTGACLLEQGTEIFRFYEGASADRNHGGIDAASFADMPVCAHCTSGT